MSHRSIRSLALVVGVAVLLGGLVIAAKNPRSNIETIAAVSMGVQAVPAAAQQIPDQTPTTASSADCPCPGECGAAEHYRQLEH